ncbi:hypothetical protein RHSIM_Rhsim10G0065400 [Rhododendron simsii]|uniref:Pentatricopeptide repeat-containing protein n=1 Tax=Rhododendron simsii TaxID=118357 RepID=A0A834LAL4_RHOSS|nr:hypothetical protein RHSIM_Rhsim10G0065400 [Rhododendron simsii]
MPLHHVEKSHVLNQLSDLLPIRRRTTVPEHLTLTSPYEQLEVRAVDGFLTPEEKLRGVFIQKLIGKTAIEQALSNTRVELIVDIVAKVVNKGNLGGEAMVMFFDWATKQPTIDKDGRNKSCFRYLGDCNGRFVRARQVSKAIRMFGQLEEFGSKCNTESLNVLLRCLCRQSHLGAANSFLNKIKGKIPFDSITYNVVISGWSKFGRIGEMEMSLRAMMEDGFDPDCLTFSYLIEGLGRAGHIDDAVDLFDSMKERGRKPDASV